MDWFYFVQIFIIFCTAENLTWIAKILRIGSYSERLPISGVSKASKSANPNSKACNRFAASVLWPYYSVHPSGNMVIARQTDRKNPIHNPSRLFLKF